MHIVTKGRGPGTYAASKLILALCCEGEPTNDKVIIHAKHESTASRIEEC